MLQPYGAERGKVLLTGHRPRTPEEAVFDNEPMKPMSKDREAAAFATPRRGRAPKAK